MFSPSCPARCSFYGTLWARIEALTDSDLPVQGAKPRCTPSLQPSPPARGPPAACGQGGGAKRLLDCLYVGMGSWGLFSRQTRLAGSRGTAPKAGAKRLSVHHKYAFSRSGTIKGAECLHGLVQCVAVRDQFLQRNLRVDHEPSNLQEL
jgi:hypothetical protein